MAKFRVGDKVRVIDGNEVTARLRAIGALVQICSIPSNNEYKRGQFYDCDVLWNGGALGAMFWQLSMPPAKRAKKKIPAADRFIESIKRLGREPINDAPKVTVTK